MTSRDFAYWLQGFFEINELNSSPEKVELNKEQVECIKKHLHMVFYHEIDKTFGEDQKPLTEIHHTTGYIDTLKPHYPGDSRTGDIGDIRINC